MDLRTLQKPLKDQYRSDPKSSAITLRAAGSGSGAPVACSVDIGRAIYRAEAHRGVGGPGTAACSGDLLLGALAACAQITCQMVAAALRIETERIEISDWTPDFPGQTAEQKTLAYLNKKSAASVEWWAEPETPEPEPIHSGKIVP